MSDLPLDNPRGETPAAEPTAPAPALAQDAPTAFTSNSTGPTSTADLAPQPGPEVSVHRVDAGMDEVEKGDPMEGVVEGDEREQTEPPATVGAPETMYVPSPLDLPPPRSSESLNAS